MSIMKPKRDVGVVGYGAYVPRYRIRAEEIARVWGGADDGLPIEEKSVAGLDTDTCNAQAGDTGTVDTFFDRAERRSQSGL